MCGITGIISQSNKKIDKELFNIFTDSLKHRGPDGRGVWNTKDFKVFLGHRRLSILDVSELGSQPMLDGTKNFVITFNGEIYNFLEIRMELKSLGYLFRSESDTEIILAAYKQWGEECQFKFNGMWAFAIWDIKNEVLFISRDRFGVKPLYYFFDGKQFAFASELKSFLHLDGFNKEINEDLAYKALCDYTSIESQEKSLLKNVTRLLGGHSLIYNRKYAEKPLIKRWWNTLDNLIDPPSNNNEIVERFKSILLNATSLRARSDVPIATALSGGLDSSSVLACLSEVMKNDSAERSAKNWQTAFIGDFPNTTQDETKYALEMANFCEVNPYIKEIKPKEAIDNIEDVIFQFEEIYDIPVALWLLYKEMKNNNISVSIDGHGGDELLGGYHHYPRIGYQSSISNPFKFSQAMEYKRIYSDMHSKGILFNRLNILDPIKNKLSPYKNLIKSKSIKNKIRNLTGPQTWLPQREVDTAKTILDDDQILIDRFDPITKQLYIDFHVSTLPTILRNFDRMSMAHGVEIRAPFLDWRMVCFAFSLPIKNKIGEGYTKLLLRKAMKNMMPESIRLRKPKLGFVFPLADWANGPLREFILDQTDTLIFRTSNIWDSSALRRDIEYAFKINDMQLIRHAWPFLQASILINQFKRIN